MVGMSLAPTRKSARLEMRDANRDCQQSRLSPHTQVRDQDCRATVCEPINPRAVKGQGWDGWSREKEKGSCWNFEGERMKHTTRNRKGRRRFVIFVKDRNPLF
jgi:hypothetical protein